MPRGESDVMHLPQLLHAPFAAALSQSMLLPAFVALFGVIAAIFMIGGSVEQDRPVEVGVGV